MTPELIIGVGLAAGLGSMLRYALQHRPAHPLVPVHTITANVVGTVILTAALTVAAHGRLSSLALTIIGAGLAGGLTTFSTLATDALGLAKKRRMRELAVYLGATLVLSLVASYATWAVVSSLL